MTLASLLQNREKPKQNESREPRQGHGPSVRGRWERQWEGTDEMAQENLLGCGD